MLQECRYEETDFLSARITFFSDPNKMEIRRKWTSNAVVIQKGLTQKLKLIGTESSVSLVFVQAWNTITLLCAHHQDMKVGQEEEEEEE